MKKIIQDNLMVRHKLSWFKNISLSQPSIILSCRDWVNVFSFSVTDTPEWKPNVMNDLLKWNTSWWTCTTWVIYINVQWHVVSFPSTTVSTPSFIIFFDYTFDNSIHHLNASEASFHRLPSSFHPTQKFFIVVVDQHIVWMIITTSSGLKVTTSSGFYFITPGFLLLSSV